MQKMNNLGQNQKPDKICLVFFTRFAKFDNEFHAPLFFSMIQSIKRYEANGALKSQHKENMKTI